MLILGRQGHLLLYQLPTLTIRRLQLRNRADLGDLHVHDLRHTVGMRLREAGVRESTIGDLLWHSHPTVTRHYSMAQIVELHAALEMIREPSKGWNKSLATLRREQEAANGELNHPKVPQARKRA